jgi:hypothetical protein
MYSNGLRFVVLAALILMTACSEAPKTAPTTTQPATPAVPVSGKTAFWEAYKSAHSWAADLVPLKLESKTIPGLKNDAGAAAMWTVTFGSPRRREALVCTYAVAAHPPDIYKGVTVARPLPWGGPSRQALPFQTSEFVVDSDSAYKTAAVLAAPWLKKHPRQEASLFLGNESRFSAPVWYVQWGDSKSGYGVFVNALTGAVTKPAK